EKAQSAARALFGGGANSADMPSTAVTDADFTDSGIGVIDLLIKASLVTSRGEGRRLIEQGGVSADDEKVTDFGAIIAKNAFDKGYVVIKKGKKIFHKIVLE
ncbi:MAG: tyrosine--tRNA ligase, partial [Clostridiales bacterium]|nr:tyrosine--tRNA ligase [Clostridiales bacterium]